PRRSGSWTPSHGAEGGGDLRSGGRGVVRGRRSEEDSRTNQGKMVECKSKCYTHAHTHTHTQQCRPADREWPDWHWNPEADSLYSSLSPSLSLTLSSSSSRDFF